MLVKGGPGSKLLTKFYNAIIVTRPQWVNTLKAEQMATICSVEKLLQGLLIIITVNFPKNYTYETCITDTLTHWGRDKKNAIFKTTFSNAFSWMKMYEFRLKFHWSLFLQVQLKISQHWFRYWLGADQATSHCLNQCWLVYWRICVTQPQWVNNHHMH